jgi:hypothetical protein
MKGDISTFTVVPCKIKYEIAVINSPGFLFHNALFVIIGMIIFWTGILAPATIGALILGNAIGTTIFFFRNRLRRNERFTWNEMNAIVDRVNSGTKKDPKE